MNSEGFKRKLIAILSADVVGYSRLMEDNEETTIQTLNAYRNSMTSLIQQHRGRVVDSTGDNLMAEFNSAVDAVNCAVEIQRELAERNADLSSKRKMEFRIGINVGDVIEEENRIYGDGVNIAARLETMAEAGGICISGGTYDQVANRLGLEYENLGVHHVKNISTPIRVFRVIMEIDSSRGLSPEEYTNLPLPDKPSIAVLPFNNMSGESEQEYFSDGITEDIITALSRSPWLFVISRNSSFAFRGPAVDVKKVSNELGVRYILEGSVRKAGDRVRVTAQLIDGTMGSHVWAEKYDGELKDIFDLQDQITQQVVAAILTQIQMNVIENAKPLERHNIGTWDLLSRGLKLYYKMTKKSIADAEKIFRKAVSLASTSCDAHHWLASSLFHQVWMGHAYDNDAVISEAYYIVKRAISLDEYNEYAHWTLGLLQFLRGKRDMAIAELKRAIELNPNCSVAYGSLGTVLSFGEESDESIRNNEIAIRSNPKDPSIFFRYSGIAMAHFVAARYPEAAQWARKSINRKPNWRIGHAVLASSLAQLNLIDEAKEAVDNFLENIPNETITDLKKVLPFKRPDDAERFENGLRNAGMPE
jgi:adenylate cyclase